MEGIAAAIGRIPSGLFILTAAFEDRRGGMLVSWVQQACFKPPTISVSIAKGRPIMPLISDSRQFGLCQLAKGPSVILRKFMSAPDQGEDPFLGFDLRSDTVTNAPILSNVLSYMECELTCHMDVEGDHDIFVGRVCAGQFNGGMPRIHVRESGLKY